MKLWLDLETYSETPIKNGTYRYAEDSEIMLFAYAVGDTPAKCWDLTESPYIPEELELAFFEADEFWAQNSMFDRSVLHYQMPDYCPPIDQWRDTMVQALEHSMPGGMEKLGDILRLSADQKKIKDGKALIQLFCKPRPANSTIRRATRLTHPAEWKRFIEYATGDIETTRELHRKMPMWNYRSKELALWHLDQVINDRGFCVDIELAMAAIETVRLEQTQLRKRTKENTQGQVDSATQRDVMLQHIMQEFGIDLPDMTKSTLQRRIDDPELPAALRELLVLRLQATSTSTSKYKALINAVNADGRCRGTIQFCGAQRTGRGAGRTFQPHNLPRLEQEIIASWHGISPRMLKEHHITEYLDTSVDAIKGGVADMLFNNVMKAASAVIRGCVVAPEGSRLVISDLANIEGRKASWLTGEDWKLQAYRDYDNKTGPDLYNLAYSKAFRCDPSDVGKDERQIGKVMELFLQYQGGVGAFATGAMTYKIDLEAMADKAVSTLPDAEFVEAENFLRWTIDQKRPTFGLSDTAFITCDVFKRLWRQSNSAVSSYWPELEEAARRAICQPGNTIECRRLSFQRDGAWLRILLPSGRYLCYPSPKIDEKGRISYMGMNQYTRKWSRIPTYGGKLFENICQACSRDVLYYNMPAVEEAGYKIVLHVHDELITEVPDTEDFSVEELSHIMATNLPWNVGLPLAAAGFETYRYRKG